MHHSAHWLRTLPNSPLIVAEIKPRSPYGFENPMHWREQLRRCEEVGDVISVHTSEWWGGSWDLLRLVRGKTKRMILAKGFHPILPEVKRALEWVDFVLTVGWWPEECEGRDRCWHEVESLAELRETQAPRVVWNSRCPRTGITRPETMEQVRAIRPDLWICQASNIRAPEDVHPSANAVLIGAGLYKQPDSP